VYIVYREAGMYLSNISACTTCSPSSVASCSFLIVNKACYDGLYG
jgi:hypothetical protein